MEVMEPDLKSLRIDRDRKGSGPSKPIARYVILSILALAILAGGLFAYNRLNAAVPVRIMQVQPPQSGPAQDEVILTVTGYIVAAHKIEVASKVVGRVAWIGVEKGDHVQAGQVIVRLEDDEYRAQLLQQQGQLAMLQAKLAEQRNGSRPEEIAKARADLDEARADLENTKITLDRTRQLANDGVLSKQNLDDAQAKYDSAAAKVASLQKSLDLEVLGPRREEIQQVEGQIEQARGAVEYAQTQLDNTVIKAPVTGTILDRNVEKGEFVTTGFVGDKGAKGYLVTMADLKDLQAELDVNQQDFPKLGPRQHGYVTTDAYPDRKYDGYIEEVSPEADRAKATVQVKVRIVNPDEYLRPDMNATVSFYNQAKPNSGSISRALVVIPPSAIQNGSVFLVAPDGRARKRTVSTAGSTDKGLLVADGLIGGEELILSPPADLKDGQKIQITQ